MISPQGSTMTRIDLCDQLFAARSHEDRPAMPSFNFGPRTELTELRPRHLLMVEEYGFDVHGFDRNALGDYFLAKLVSDVRAVAEIERIGSAKR